MAVTSCSAAAVTAEYLSPYFMDTNFDLEFGIFTLPPKYLPNNFFFGGGGMNMFFRPPPKSCPLFYLNSNFQIFTFFFVFFCNFCLFLEILGK